MKRALFREDTQTVNFVACVRQISTSFAIKRKYMKLLQYSITYVDNIKMTMKKRVTQEIA